MSGFLSSLFSNSSQGGSNDSIIGNLPVVPENITRTSNFNKNYAIYLHGRDETNTKIRILASIPEQFGLHLASDWHALLSTASAGEVASNSGITSGFVASTLSSIGNIAQSVAGQTDISPKLTHQVWSGTSPISFSIPFQFNAIDNVYKDVAHPIKTLMKLESPSLGLAKLLKAPGPTLLSKKNHGSPYKIALNIGNFITFDNIIITGVSLTTDSMFDINGNPLSAQADVSISTSRIYTKTDIDNIFVSKNI